jgi:hypothetical protein
MNKLNRNAFLVVVAACSLPTLAQAGTTSMESPAGFDSCVKAFVDSLPSKIGSAPKILDSKYLPDVRDGSEPTELAMVARNPKTKKAVWKATCLVNSRGEVTKLLDEMVSKGL